MFSLLRWLVFGSSFVGIVAGAFMEAVDKTVALVIAYIVIGVVMAAVDFAESFYRIGKSE